ncbi:MAG: Holliday junction branch migration DNA helicase RuvB [Spirochaetes bacterium]|nr:Holliday junction branch migration DNA helicase RuvB [Spirochaetota bacterium]
MEHDAVITPEHTEDDTIDHAIRPKLLNDFVGQTELKEKLSIYVGSAKIRSEPLDHTLFYGPPGLGKTTLAMIIAHEMGVEIRSTSAPVIERAGDLASILTTLKEGDVFFIDEVHRLKPQVEEILYSAMEDYFVDIKIGEGVAAKSYRVPLPKFTLVGATTRAGMLSSPLYHRFGIVERLNFYNEEELCRIVARSCKLLDIPIESAGASMIARRARGTPRIVNRLIRRMRDYAVMKSNGVITEDNGAQALKLLGIDERGLDALDKKYLRVIIEHYGGGPVGIETIAVSLSEDPETIEDVVEPYLIQCGFVRRTPKGRMTTRGAWQHLGITHNAPDIFTGIEE